MRLPETTARVLIVDDRPENLTVLEAILAPLGCPIEKANSGADALRHLLEHDDFAVILLDVQLPDIDGFEVATMIKEREKTRYIPIIFITAISTDQRNIFQGYSAGAVDYIAKPFHPDILVSKVLVFIDLYRKGEQIKAQAEELRKSQLRDAESRRRVEKRSIERKHLAELESAYAREKRIAEVLQRSFLLAPPEAAFPGITVATRYEAAWEEANLGGDFFDAFLVGGDKVALVVGDVTGKGLIAASRTAEAKYSLRAFMRDCPDPGHALGRLNRTLLSQWADTEGQAFVCVSVVVCDCSTGRFFASSAGCEAAIVVRSSGQLETVGARGLPLGIDVVGDYEVSELQLNSGDVIVMVTDGITEARNGGELFGQEGIAAHLTSKSADLTPNAIVESLLSKAKQFAGGKLQDDACLLAVRLDSP